MAFSIFVILSVAQRSRTDLEPAIAGRLLAWYILRDISPDTEDTAARPGTGFSADFTWGKRSFDAGLRPLLKMTIGGG